jgi:hypothetical protein
VTLTNTTSFVQDANSIAVVFLANGQELESGGPSGPRQSSAAHRLARSNS